MLTREVVLITGKTGSGKSVFFRNLIQQKERFIIFDTIAEYPKLSPPFPALFIYTYQDLIGYLLNNHNKPFKIVFVPLEDYKALVSLKTGEQISIFDLVCKVVYETLEDVTFGVEEIANFVNHSFIPDYLDRIVRLGRHASISLFATTQRPPDMHSNLKAQATKLISFRQHLPNDIDWIGDCIGDKKEAETLRALERFTWGNPMLSGKHYKEYEL